jgi:peptidyl-prolyl cis-trans isomerase-like 4
VIEGLDTLDRINDAFLDKEGRPLQDIRIRHVEILGERGGVTSRGGSRSSLHLCLFFLVLGNRGEA